MKEKQGRTHQEVIEKITDYIKKESSGKEATFLIGLISHFYRTIPLEDFTTRSIENLYGIASSYLQFMQQRKSGECKLRIYNPQTHKNRWQTTHTVIELSYNDMPFLVDSMRIEIERLGLSIHLIVSAGGVKVRRDKKGKLLEILPFDRTKTDDKEVLSEAVIHIEIDRETSPKILETIKKNLLRSLRDVTVVVDDYHRMAHQLQKTIDELKTNAKNNSKEQSQGALSEGKQAIASERTQKFISRAKINPSEIEEVIAFLNWLADNRFTFLGYRAYEIIGEGDKAALKLIPKTGLGVLRDESNSKIIRYFHELPAKARKLWLSSHILIIAKTNTKSTVHRLAYTDYIGIKRFNDKGQIIGEHRFIGLYTSEAYSSDPLEIPFLRHKVEMVLQKSGLPWHGHGERALRNILATLPRDDLFQANVDELYELAIGVMNMQGRRLIRLFIRKDTYGRYFSCLVYVPRDNFNTELIHKMSDILKTALRGTEITFSTQFQESVLARVHFVIRTDRKESVTYDIKELENKLIAVGRSWYDGLRDSLLEHFDEERANELFHKYQNCFPAGYRETFSPANAVHDIVHIEKLKSPNDLEMSFYDLFPHDLPREQNPGVQADAIASDQVQKLTSSAKSNGLSFKLFHLTSTIPLSDALPMFEKMGMRVIGEQPYEIRFPQQPSVWINDFIMEYLADVPFNIAVYQESFQNAFYKVWRQEIENDNFNQLILKAHLNWQEVTLFRAYAKYLRQIGFTFSQSYIEETLVANPDVVVLLLQLFKLLFDPVQEKDQAEKIKQIEHEISQALDKIVNLDQDRIVRRFWHLIKATLRTNFFQKEQDGQPKSYLSFKFAPEKISELPLPLPKYEIFVYSPRFEGVHLRAGKIARGGIRWSDRREDFRTEVLGLMKAQQVKNALIVPAGAKGGFVPKMLPTDNNRDAIMAEAIACYKNFIRGLLDITDNLVADKIVHPRDVVFHDTDDPYLVVAADKGTASFSDIANEISKEYNFWLGDAFASGGVTGYDHKKMAITSRGVWESVKHHFQLLALNINKPFTVVGIGDMSGDVFGNGMLLSNKIKLIAAYNHMHIFIDPDPDPQTSYDERQRLFNLPRSSWEDYNRALLSQGGNIYLRNVKSVRLSPEAQLALDFKHAEVEPNELIRAILKAPVDLIWNGGIGTYVKALSEKNSDVGDRANDAIRVNGSELRCRIVAEGGNLGCTQLGRIEYELSQEGKINTDFIDNSAGVDCSDHEVNSKILLDACVHNKTITESERNQILAEMREPVAKLVLHDNYRQVRTITREKNQAMDHFTLYMNYLDYQETHGEINRKLEFLPDKAELLERKAIGKTLTRPEIAILLSYNKIILKKEIIKATIVNDPYLIKFIYSAFPKELQKRFVKQMEQHKLRNSIIATQLSNTLVNEMGIAFVYQLRDETSVSMMAVVQAYVIMRELFNMPWVLAAIDEFVMQHPTAANIEIEMTLEAMQLTRRGVRWLLRNQRPPYDIAATIAQYADYVNQLYQELPNLLIGVEKENFQAKLRDLTVAKVPTEVALKIASARYIYAALNIILVATKQKASAHNVAIIYFDLADRLELGWFREKINTYPVDERWSVLARSSFKDELDAEQRALTISVLKYTKKHSDIPKAIQRWLQDKGVLLQRWQEILTQLHNVAIIDAAMLTVAIRTLSEMAN